MNANTLVENAQRRFPVYSTRGWNTSFWLFLLSFRIKKKSGLTGIELGLKVCQHFEN